jgi:hypothetical protein
LDKILQLLVKCRQQSTHNVSPQRKILHIIQFKQRVFGQLLFEIVRIKKYSWPVVSCYVIGDQHELQKCYYVSTITSHPKRSERNLYHLGTTHFIRNFLPTESFFANYQRTASLDAVVGIVKVVYFILLPSDSQIIRAALKICHQHTTKLRELCYR